MRSSIFLRSCKYLCFTLPLPATWTNRHSKKV